MEEELINITDVEKPFEKCEWCFQFDDDEPVILASQQYYNDDKLVIEFGNTPRANAVFISKNGQQFKIFAREKINHENKDQKEDQGQISE